MRNFRINDCPDLSGSKQVNLDLKGENHSSESGGMARDHIAIGSSFEVETQLTISFNLGYIEESTFQETVARLNILQKRINAFRNTLKPV